MSNYLISVNLINYRVSNFSDWNVEKENKSFMCDLTWDKNQVLNHFLECFCRIKWALLYSVQRKGSYKCKSYSYTFIYLSIFKLQQKSPYCGQNHEYYWNVGFIPNLAYFKSQLISILISFLWHLKPIYAICMQRKEDIQWWKRKRDTSIELCLSHRSV